MLDSTSGQVGQAYSELCGELYLILLFEWPVRGTNRHNRIRKRTDIVQGEMYWYEPWWLSGAQTSDIENDTVFTNCATTSLEFFIMVFYIKLIERLIKIKFFQSKSVLSHSKKSLILLSFFSGDFIVGGDVRIEEESVLMGLLNTHNVTEFANLCSLTGDTISCRSKWFTNVTFCKNV